MCYFSCTKSKDEDVLFHKQSTKNNNRREKKAEKISMG